MPTWSSQSLPSLSWQMLSVFEGVLRPLLMRSLTCITILHAVLSLCRLSQIPLQMEMTEVMLKVGVKAVTGTHVELSDGSSIPYGLAVWAAGNGPLPLVLDLIDGVDEQKEKAAWGRSVSTFRIRGTQGCHN